jgi:hypothetical protein
MSGINGSFPNDSLRFFITLGSGSASSSISIMHSITITLDPCCAGEPSRSLPTHA